jgi:hypothetical protein
MDASNRDQCEVTRLRTNTPLQALVLMNDPQYLEAARVLAQRMANTTGTPREKIRVSFRKILCRQPNEKELNRMEAYYQNEYNKFKGRPERSAALLSAGEYKQITTADPAETAALMQLNHMLINLDETTIK